MGREGASFETNLPSVKWGSQRLHPTTAVRVQIVAQMERPMDCSQGAIVARMVAQLVSSPPGSGMVLLELHQLVMLRGHYNQTCPIAKGLVMTTMGKSSLSEDIFC